MACSQQVEDLNQYIDKNTLECLNYDQTHPVQNALFDHSETIYLASDCDEQIRIQFAFLMPVKIQQIIMTPVDKNSAPQTVKLFVDQINLSFDECLDNKPTEELNLVGDNLKIKPVHYSNVKELTIFVQDNNGSEDVTKIGNIRILGNKLSDTNMKELKKVG